MSLKAIGRTIVFTAKKYAPEILMTVGVTGVVGSTVLACKATLKCEGLLDTYHENLDKAERASVLAAEGAFEYTEEDLATDQKIFKMNLILDFIKLYGPSATLMLASVGCILGSHKIMSRRNVALVAAYKLVEEAFVKYRGRVVEEFGAAKDAEFRYGTKFVETTEEVVDEDGNKQEVTVRSEELIPGSKLSGFARMFEGDKPDQYGGWTGSTQWCKVHDYNLDFLIRKEQHFNDILVSKGFVTMNDVYDALGFERTEAGMVCGWRYKSDQGDGYISFRPHGIDGNWAFGRDGDSVVLDFNCEGSIFSTEKAKKELE